MDMIKRWIALAVLFAAPVLTAQAPPVPDDLPDSTESVVLTGIKTCTNVDAAKGSCPAAKKGSVHLRRSTFSRPSGSQAHTL